MSKKNDLKAIKCTECGGDLAKSYRIEYDDDDEEHIPIAKCMNCGKEYDQYTQEYYALYADDLTYDKDNTVFKLGLKGTLDGVEYEIIGRIRYQEEDEYEKSTWDEWLAISSDGVYHYFVEEDGEVHSYEEYVPESIDMESDPNYILFEGKKVNKNDEENAYVGRIVHAEGELPWEAEIGEPVKIYDFKKDGKNFTIEQAEDEINITRGTEISYEKIIEAFGEDKDKELYAKTMKKRKDYKIKAFIYLAFAVVTFGMSCYNCSYEKPVKGVMTSPNIITENQSQHDKSGYYYFSQVVYGPFKVAKGSTLYEIDVKVNERIQRLSREWQSFRLMIIKEDRMNKVLNKFNLNKDQIIKKKKEKKQEKKKETKKKTSSLGWGGGSSGSSGNSDWDGGSSGSPGGRSANRSPLKKMLDEIDVNKDVVESYSMSGDFWDEVGYDSEGYWHENDLKASSNFVLDQGGNYYVYLELYNKKPRRVTSVQFKMNEVKSYRYYVMLYILFFILFAVNKSKSTSYNELPFEVSN